MFIVSDTKLAAVLQRARVTGDIDAILLASSYHDTQRQIACAARMSLSGEVRKRDMKRFVAGLGSAEDDAPQMADDCVIQDGHRCRNETPLAASLRHAAPQIRVAEPNG